MVQQLFSRVMDNLISSVKLGMEVYDSQDRRIGKIEDVYAGTSNPTQDQLGDPFINQIARGFRSDNLSEELRQRLLHEGYIRIGGDGLSGSARYILPEQITSVSDNSVTLRVNRDELIKR